MRFFMSSSRSGQLRHVEIVDAGGLAAGDPRIGVRGRLGLFVVRPPARISASKRRAEKRSAFRRSKARAHSRHARLPPQPRSGRNKLLHRQPARLSFESVGEADRYIARRGSPGAHSGTLPHRRLGRPSRSHALSVDLAPGRRQFPRAVARNQNRFCEIFACRRVTITRDDQSRGTRDLAAPVLGAHDTRRWRLCNSHGLYAFQPGETRSRGAPSRLAIFIVSPVRRRWAVPSGVDRRERRTARDE